MNRYVAVASMLGLLSAQAEAQAKPTAIFAGTVVDSMQRPIASAEVSLPALAITKVTDDNGAFRVSDIPAGTQRIVVRRIGYGQLDTAIVFAEGQTIERRVTLGRVVRLDSVVVDAAKSDPLMADFETNRARGVGRFVTRAELEKMSGQSLGSILQQLPGLGVIRGSRGQTWVISKRAPATHCPPTRQSANASQAAAMQRATDDCLRSERLYYVPEESESQEGMRRACYAVVFLDRSALNSRHPTEPFDASTFAPNQLQGIEWYDNDAEVPATYGGRDARCGLAVFHTRRG